MRRAIIYLAFLLCFNTITLAQSWVVQYYGTNEGLESPDIWSIHQDANNLIWVGTMAGVSIFDGGSFINYSHTSNGKRIGKVNSIIEYNKLVLLGSDQGLFYWDKGNIHQLSSSNLSINTLCISNENSLWIGTEKGLFSIQEDEFMEPNKESKIQALEQSLVNKQLGEDNRITQIKSTPSGSMLISTYYSLFRYNKDSLVNIWGSPNIKLDIYSIEVISDNHFYWACSKKNFFEYKNGSINPVFDSDQLAFDLKSQNGNIWMITVDNLYKLKDDKIITIPLGQEKPEWLREILIDNENNTWITSFEGLIKIKESYFTNYNNMPDHNMNEIYGIGRDIDGNLLIGGNRGRLWKRSGNSFTLLLGKEKSIFKNAEIFGIYSDDSSLWLGSGYQGIARYENGVLNNFTTAEGLADNSRYFFFRDSKNKLWTGGDGGVDLIEIKEDNNVAFTNFRHQLDNNSYFSFYCAIENPNGEIWFGGTHGFFTIHDGKFKHRKINDFNISPLYITDIKMNKSGEIWISSLGEGIIKCNFDTAGNISFLKQFTVRDGLPTNAFLSIVIDDDNNIWGGSYQGIAKIKPDAPIGVKGIRFYDKNDGFLNASFTNMRLFKEGNNKIWGVTSEGLFCFNPASINTNMHPPTPLITSVQNMDGREKWANYSSGQYGIFGLPKDVILPYNNNLLRFHLSSVGMTKPSAHTLRYKLEGLDDVWNYTLNEKTVTYHQLNHGTYRFVVEAANEDGIWSPDGEVFEFSIRPAFWQNIWFRILTVLLLVLGGIRMYHFLKFKRVNKTYTKTIEYFANSSYSSNTVDEILWDVSRNIISRLDLEDCVVYMMEDGYLVQKAAYGTKNPKGRIISTSLSIPIGEGIVGHCASAKKPIRVEDTTKDNRYVFNQEQKGSELSVPILDGNEVIGVIDSEHSRKGFFKKHHEDVLQKIAEQCAHKIASAKAKEEIEAKEKILLNIQKEVAESKLTALQAQMNPHFVFNSLNSINWYIVKNRPAEASEYLSKFSKLVRLILDNSKKSTIPLDKEIEALRIYLDLESMRFEDRFDYKIQMDKDIELEDVQIPPLILQPFVENAIWHGLMHKKGKGEILIQIYPENDHIKCVIQDNGIGRKASSEYQNKKSGDHKSKGMKLTSARIKLLHKEFLDIDMVRIIDLEGDTGEAVGTRVEIILPFEE